MGRKKPTPTGVGFCVSKNLLVRQHPRLPLTRELSVKLTEGEKMLHFLENYQVICNFGTLSPSHGLSDSPKPTSTGVGLGVILQTWHIPWA